MKLDHAQVKHIAWLARLGVSQGEVDRFSLQLSDILENFEVLNEVDTTAVPPAAHSVALQNVLRQDEAADSCPQAEVLSNAPKKTEDCFEVQAILE